MDVLDGKIGAEAKYGVAFVGGALKVSADYIGKQVSGGMNISVDAEQVVEALFAVLPKGAVEDEVKVVMLAALKMIPA